MNIDKFGRHLIVGVTHQTNTDKFGRHISTSRDSTQHLSTSNSSRGIPLTSDGQYNIEDKRLSNVHTPIDDSDGVNKVYVDKITLIQKIKLEKLQLDQVHNIGTLKKSLVTIEQSLSNQQKHLDTSLHAYKAELDAIEHKRHSTDIHLERRIDDLIKSYDLSIENLHKKLKRLENLVQP